ncbi:MAG: RcpC/CpaB family pilus assembly protein [Gaiellales bacterium]
MNYTIRNLVVATTLMLIGILAVTSFIRSERQQLSRDKQEIQVLVAAKDIPAGTPAKDLEAGGFLETMSVVREAAPPNPIGKITDLKPGDVVNDTVYAGRMLDYNTFNKMAGLKPTSQIKGNERLFTLPILAANDVAGLIRPGDHVDLATTMSANGSFKHVILARDVEVIETPESLRPEGLEGETAAPEAKGDSKLYVFRATDSEAQNIQFGLSAADGHQIFMWLRPANGDTNTKLDPLVGPNIPEMVAPNIKGTPGADTYGPDPSVR